MSASAGPPTPSEVLTAPSLTALRAMQTGGFSRRMLLRRALAACVWLLAVEWLGGSLAFAWSAGSAAARKVRIGTLDDLVAINPDLPVREGFPTYVPAARAFIVIVNPEIGGFQTGTDVTGNGSALNVRALSQICPHLGSRFAGHRCQPQQPPRDNRQMRVSRHDRPPSVIAFQIRSRTR